MDKINQQPEVDQLIDPNEKAREIASSFHGWRYQDVVYILQTALHEVESLAIVVKD